MQFITTGLCNDVHVTASEAAILDINRCDFHRDLLGHIKRKRQALCWVTIIVEAEIVVLTHTVNGQ